MELARPATVEARPWWRRWVGLALVALVHAVLIAFVTASLPKFFLSPQREFVFVFPPPLPPPPLPKAKVAPVPRERVSAPALYRFTVPPAGPTTALSPPATGLGLSLFGCAPENLANLTPQDRAHCSGGLGLASMQGSIPGALTIHSIQTARWRAAIAARNAPLSVPCTNLQQQPAGGPFQEPGIGPGGTVNVATVDPLCALHQLAGSGAP